MKYYYEKENHNQSTNLFNSIMMQTISAIANTMSPVAVLMRTAVRKDHIEFSFLNHELHCDYPTKWITRLTISTIRMKNINQIRGS